MKVNIYSLFAFLLFISTLSTSFALPPDKSKKGDGIKWLTLEEAAAKSKTAPRKVFVDVYTDWCGWCKRMDKSTFSDPAVVDYVNKNFYAVKLDAEGKEPITINGKTYKYNAQYRTHEAALALLNMKLGYPTTVYLDEKFGIISPVPGYLDAPTFRHLLTYFNEEHYKKKTFDEFKATAKAK